MYYLSKTHILTKSTNLCEKDLEMMENVFFIGIDKNNKAFCRKSFSVFWGLTCEIFFLQKFIDLVNIFFFTCNTF